ncbi:MAG: hypothetical protein ACYTG2_14540 [Planctomycetota bacterium]
MIRQDAAPTDLRGTPTAGVRTPWDGLPTALAAARVTRAPRVIVDLPPLMGLERACRELHELAGRNPGLGLAVLTPSGGALAEPGSLALLFEDLASKRLCYWHRPAAVDGLGQVESSWLDTLSRHLVGMSLDDVADGEGGLPPGLGRLDFEATAEACARTLEVALDIDPVPDVGLLRLTVDQLRTQGFA